MPREFLGVGWKFPIRVNARGGLSFSRHEQDIEEAVWIILSTAKGERVMEPDFGCGIHELVFAPNNPSTRAAITYEVQKSLSEYEPRIEVENVLVQSSPGPRQRFSEVAIVGARIFSPPKPTPGRIVFSVAESLQ